MIEKPKKVYVKALDPIHIGAGGYRLGRVDNTIVRDPATDVPKIPGTSIAGVVKEFYTISIIMEKGNGCKDKKGYPEKRKCAEEKVKPIFGDDTRKGISRFYDGQIIFFPVSSIQGTVWITTKEVLEYWFAELKDERGENVKIPEGVKEEAYALKGVFKKENKALNLGWILINIGNVLDGKEIKLPESIDKWIPRIVLVSEKLFSHIVNDNLEVRTSVRIDSETGAAAPGALFTYEAIPRGTVLGFEIGVDKYKNESTDVNNIIDAVSPYFKKLGIGGMGTRGFGRLELARVEDSEVGETNAQS